MSVVLTVISLGVRVALAYTLAAIPGIGVWGIWWSIPIGWFLADIFGWCYYRMKQRKSLEWLSLFKGDKDFRNYYKLLLVIRGM